MPHNRMDSNIILYYTNFIFINNNYNSCCRENIQYPTNNDALCGGPNVNIGYKHIYKFYESKGE